MVKLRCGRGTAYDISISLGNTSPVLPAIAVVILNVEAAWTYAPLDPVVNPLSDQQVIPIPASVSADGLTATLEVDADETAGYADMAGAYSWDAYAETAEFGWQRICEGTWTIIKGDSR